MALKIDKNLNLVIPIYGDEVQRMDPDNKPVIENGEPVVDQPVVAYVHSSPISREVFERFFMVISQTFTAIYNQGIGRTAGPAVSLLLLKNIAVKTEQWSGPDGVEACLVEDIRRLTMVVANVGGKWTPIPLKVAVQQGIISAEDLSEVENAIVFFIVNSAILKRAARKEMLEESAKLWGGQITSSGSTEFIASLPTSTGTGSSGEKEPPREPAVAAPAQTPSGSVDGKPSSLPV